MTSNEKPPENSNGGNQTSPGDVDYSLDQRRAERVQMNELMGAISEQQAVEAKSPELRELIDKIFRKEQKLAEQEREYVHYRDEYEGGSTPQDLSQHQAIITHLKKELENLKEEKRQLIEKLRNEEK